MYRQRLVSPSSDTCVQAGEDFEVRGNVSPRKPQSFGKHVGGRSLFAVKDPGTVEEDLPVSSQCDIEKEKAVLKRRQQRKKLHEFHRCMASTGAAAVAASAALFTTQVDSKMAQLDGSSKFRKRFSPGSAATAGRPGVAGGAERECAPPRAWGPIACVRTQIAKASRQLRDAAADLSNAIGESPRSRRAAATGEEEELEMPLSLLWVVNLIILCTVVSALLLAWAFASQHDVDAAATTSEASLPAAVFPADGSRRPRRQGIGCLALGSLSFMAGAALHVFHPLKSAMLLAV
jgi:hypothetical protein